VQSLFLLLVTCLLSLPLHAQNILGTQVLASSEGAKITVFYPVLPGTIGKPGPLGAVLAAGASVGSLNQRLVVISHGSGGSPWVHTHLAQALVQRGYVVAFPTHYGDNFEDPSAPGPDSWKRRPQEVSQAIDALQAHPEWSQKLAFDKVGMYGQSAGGHTALSLAGGRWSTKNFLAHCNQQLANDFNACVGTVTRLTGGAWDGIKKWLASWVLNSRFASDDGSYTHHDPRIAVVVAGNPYAADFDEQSLRALQIPLGLVSTGQDAWLKPEFHSSKVLRACKNCSALLHWPLAGHGALLSPYPINEPEKVHTLLASDSNFDRKVLATGDQTITDYLDRYLR
jgi:pimeloyl-ACP methyl ester carboxylesterase